MYTVQQAATTIQEIEAKLDLLLIDIENERQSERSEHQTPDLKALTNISYSLDDAARAIARARRQAAGALRG